MRIARKIFTSLLLAALVYFNVAALLLVCEVRLPKLFQISSRPTRGPLPNHWATERLFRMFNLFMRWDWYNSGFGAYGMRKQLRHPPAVPNASMIDLDIYRYFPQSLGEANRRVFLTSYRRDKKRVSREYLQMADIIQRLHNEAHPEDPVEQVAIYHYRWRKTKHSYKSMFGKREITLIGSN